MAGNINKGNGDFLDELDFTWGTQIPIPVAESSMDPRLDRPLKLFASAIEEDLTPNTYSQEVDAIVLGIEGVSLDSPGLPTNATADLTAPPEAPPIHLLRCKVLSGPDTEIITTPPDWQAHTLEGQEGSILGDLNSVLINTTYPAFRYKPGSGPAPSVGDVITVRYDHETYRTGVFIGYPPDTNKILPPGVMAGAPSLGGMFGSAPQFVGECNPYTVTAPASHWTPSDEIIQEIRHGEGMVLYPYDDSKGPATRRFTSYQGFFKTGQYSPRNEDLGYATIGVGHLIKVHETSKYPANVEITEAAAMALFKKDLISHAKPIAQHVKVPISQGQYDALASFIYNVGSGNFRKSQVLALLNAGDCAGAAGAFMNHTKSRGKELAGLVRRRTREAQRFVG